MRTLGHFTNAFIAPPTPGTDEPQPKDVIPFGKYGGGGWAGHPIGLVIVVGVMLVGLIGVPPIRLFFLLAAPIGVLIGYLLWRRHRRELFPNPIVQFGRFGVTALNGTSAGIMVVAVLLLLGFTGMYHPIVKLCVFVAIPFGSIIGLILWRRSAQDSQPLIPRKP